MTLALPLAVLTSLSELTSSQPVPEGLNSIDCYHGNVVTVAIEQGQVVFDIDLLQRVKAFAVGGAHGFLRLIAEMTFGTAVNDHSCFHGQERLSASALGKLLLASRSEKRL
mgnify:CR=1 FL=1